ncbi:lactonohydrolase [Bombardia bombarda]|uniref:Lactonohydrolase n=1 Tax=Bombardia bombarda TaxID=252184 RepID=A0AA39X7S6_9PEZI|nr:lactonohydrolase [Bombardia bombarda]
MGSKQLSPIRRLLSYLALSSQVISPALSLRVSVEVDVQIPLLASKGNDEQAPLKHQHELARSCPSGHNFPHVVCIHQYGSLIHGDFEREVRNVLADMDTYPSTNAPGESTFGHTSDADFLVWESAAGADILGLNPSVEFMFEVAERSHEAPIYSPSTNELYFSRLQRGFLPQLVVDLNQDPPTLSERLANPPIYAASGARFHEGLIYFCTLGGNSSLNGHSFRPGIYTLDPTTGESKTVLNNYYGWYFNGVDDFDIDDEGQIWFTDNNYARPVHVNTHAPKFGTGTYRFNLTSGLASLVEDSLIEPNGVAFSPDKKTLYLTDTGAGSSVVDPHVYPAPPIHVNSTGPRTIYAYDMVPSRKTLLNKRPIYRALDYAPDGIKVSREGYLVTATGHGIDVLTAEGEPLVRVQTNFTVINIAWAGKEGEELWAVGVGGVARVRWGLRGPVEE